MAAKKALAKRSPKVEFKGYLNVNLSAEDDILFDEWYGGGNFDFNSLFNMIDFGYKISFSEDEYNDGFSVSMYAKSTKLDWVGWTLTAWAGDLNEAAALCFYKHWVIAKQDWNQFTGKPAKTNAKRG